MKYKTFIFIILWVCSPSNGLATTCDGSQSDCQIKITAASDNETVYIPAGSFTWADPVTWSNKNINVIGAGSENTTITCSDRCFGITGTNASKMAWRVSGMALSGPTSSGNAFYIDTTNVNAYSYGWRIDHVDIAWSSGADVMVIYGPTWGLIDHISIGKAAGVFILIADLTSNDYSAGWDALYSVSLPMDFGTNKAVYIEDSTFTCVGNPSGGCAFLDSSSGGSRVVFRRNTGSGGFLYSHWTRQTNAGARVEIDGHKFEIYGNSMDGGSYGTGGGYPFRFESGTGVIYNNTLTDYGSLNAVLSERRGCGAENGVPANSCDGNNSWDGNYGDASAPGWPCLGQIGRGTGYNVNTTGTGSSSPPSVPMLFWNNGTQAGCSTGGADCTNALGVTIWNGDGGTWTCTRATANYIIDGSAGAHHDTVGTGNGDADYCQGSTMPESCGTYTNTYTALGDHPLADAADIIPPTVTAFTIPSSMISPTIAVTMTATDDVGVTGYCITQDSVSTGCSWAASAIESFTMTNQTGTSETLYAWAKDAADNISASLSANVTINYGFRGVTLKR